MDEIISSHIYCAHNDTPKHKGKKSTYLVERLLGSNVVRISSMPMVREVTAPHEVVINALKAKLAVQGEWSPKNHHAKIQVITLRGAHKNVKGERS
jgi:hypothetical protein